MRDRSSITRSSTCIRSSYCSSPGWRHCSPRFGAPRRDFIARFAISLIAPVSYPLSDTAEGNGKRQGKQRTKFFRDARGSAVECAACLDALAAKTLVTKARIAEGKALLLRIVGMLTKLVERFDAYRAREGEEADD